MKKASIYLEIILKSLTPLQKSLNSIGIGFKKPCYVVVEKASDF
jgi:hypothetical protein